MNQTPNDSIQNLGDTLETFSRNEVRLERIFRALVEHNGWIAPTLLLEQHYGWNQFESLQIFSSDSRLRPDVMWLFSDVAEVFTAQGKGALPGVCACGLSGIDLFAEVPLNLEALIVNPGSPTERSFSLQKTYLPMARGWGQAIRFEHNLPRAATQTPAELEVIFRDSPELIVFVDTKGAVVTLRGFRDLKNAAVAFTAPDCVGAFVEKLSVEEAGSIRQIPTTGAELMDKMPTHGVDGIIINPFGPGRDFLVRFKIVSG